MPVHALAQRITSPAAQVANRWYCLVYTTITGAIVGELPVSDANDPTWAQQINQQGSYAVTTPIGPDTAPPTGGALSRSTLRGLVSGARFGLAICWGSGSTTDWIAQAGPIWTSQLVSESPPLLRVGGSGLWGILNGRWQIPSTYNGASLADPSATVSYTTSLQGIASNLISNQISRGSLPIDVPSALSGTTAMTYFGYDLTSTGQRLQELTQLDLGPDILFRPYFADAGHIRWQALIGNPFLSQPGSPLVWDYGSSLASVLTSSDASKLQTTSYVKGNGVEAAVLWALATDVTLTGNGWPLLEGFDTSHSNIISQTQLQAQANADQKLYGRPVETWTSVVRIDQTPLPNTYTPGVNATYNFSGDPDHPWIPPGVYQQRIIGLQNGQNQGELVHILQATSGAA